MTRLEFLAVIYAIESHAKKEDLKAIQELLQKIIAEAERKD